MLQRARPPTGWWTSSKKPRHLSCSNPAVLARHRLPAPRPLPVRDVSPGRTPKEWITSGATKRADSLEDLARQCGIDTGGLLKTVERFNTLAARGVDEDFHRGEGDHEQFYGDPTHAPNPYPGPVSKPPFYAVALYPGDIGTSGGLLCDELDRVLDTEGNPVDGLYATGKCTASVMGRKNLGAGASIAASAVFGHVAAGYTSSAGRAT
ncbi:FAD-binding protein [Streptomyces sp. NBC_01518]|uniref:FAD-binding protein n=1 Tax=Streptomyces sp. NBC_01518 TaxID=2903891 RepID=UPI00386F03DE